MARRSSAQPDGRDGLRRRARRPRRARRRSASPVAWLTTTPDQRALGVEHADAGGVERDAPVRVGRAVHRVDDRQQSGRPVARSPPTPRTARPDRLRAGSGSAAASAARSRRYWPGRVPAGPQSSSSSSATRTARDRVVEHPEQPVLVHEVTHPTGRGRAGRPLGSPAVAAIDVAGYVADLKDHSVDHGFHVHDERHFVETYSLRQVWEVDLHPEEGCGGPLDLHLALDVDPRVLLSFEDAVVLLSEEEEPPDEFHFPLTFTWALPPLPSGPDLLRLAIDLAGVGGIELPLEVSAIDSFANATDGSERRLSIVARHPVSLARVLGGEELLCDVFDRALAVSRFLLESAEGWLG